MGKKNKGGKGSGAHNPKTEGGPDTVRGKIAALTTEIQNTNKLLEVSVDYEQTSSYGIKLLTNVIGDMESNVAKIVELMTANRLKEKEADAERAKMMEDMFKLMKDKKEPKKEEKKGDFSWLGLAASLVAGLVMGGVAFIKNYIKGLEVFWTAMAKAFKVDGIITAIFTKIKNGFTFIQELVTGGFTKAWAWLKGLFAEMKWLKSIEEFFVGVGKYLTKIFNLGEIGKDFEQLWASIKGIWEMMGKPLKFLGKIFGEGGGGLLSYFTDLLSFFKPLMGFFKGLGAILGKLALPLQVIMSVFDTVSGALDGWNKTEGTFFDKLTAAIKGGLTGLVNGLIGGLLDLLKDGLSFILDFFGMKDAAAWLDSFSFSDIFAKGIGSLVDGLIGMFKDLISGPVKMFEAAKGLWEGKIDWTTFLKQALAGLITALLAPVNMVSKWAGFDLTKKALDLLGLNDTNAKPAAAAPAAAAAPTPAAETPAPPTPALVAKEAQAPAQAQETLQQAQDRLDKAVAEGQMSKADANVEKMKLGLRPSFGRANQNFGKDMSAPAVPISSRTTNYDPEDAMARGAVMP